MDIYDVFRLYPCMINAQPNQFRLADSGYILFQKDASNPLPGENVARLRKGKSIIAPEIDMLDGAGGVAERDAIAAWLRAHIKETLATLVDLEDVESLPGPARAICFQLFEAMGIVPREALEEMIAGLDPAMRQSLRTKQVRLGPVLVFLPALNKPAAVRMRGLLWSLWNEKSLPAPVPADGVVSIKVDERADKKFYQAIGYPVYGPRAIRIDMLDRVISAVYDNAKEGKFRAEHKMAEWLGSSIDDLYAVLSAMGHRKIEELKKPEEVKPEEIAATEEPKVEAASNVKPDLAMFFLKKGKAFEQAKQRVPRPEKFRSEKPRKGGKHIKPSEPRVLSAGPTKKMADSPFAILEQLKVKKDAAGS